MAAIKGRVTSPDGAPIEGASIFIVSGPAHNDLASETDRAGRYELGPLVAGTYQVSVAADGFISVRGPVPVRHGRVTRADVTLQYDQVQELDAIVESQGDRPGDGLIEFAAELQQGRRRRSRNVPP